MKFIVLSKISSSVIGTVPPIRPDPSQVICFISFPLYDMILSSIRTSSTKNPRIISKSHCIVSPFVTVESQNAVNDKRILSPFFALVCGELESYSPTEMGVLPERIPIPKP